MMTGVPPSSLRRSSISAELRLNTVLGIATPPRASSCVERSLSRARVIAIERLTKSVRGYAISNWRATAVP